MQPSKYRTLPAAPGTSSSRPPCPSRAATRTARYCRAFRPGRRKLCAIPLLPARQPVVSPSASRRPLADVPRGTLRSRPSCGRTQHVIWHRLAYPRRAPHADKDNVLASRLCSCVTRLVQRRYPALATRPTHITSGQATLSHQLYHSPQSCIFPRPSPPPRSAPSTSSFLLSLRRSLACASHLACPSLGLS